MTRNMESWPAERVTETGSGGKIGITLRQPFLGRIEWIQEDLKVKPSKAEKAETKPARAEKAEKKS